MVDYPYEYSGGCECGSVSFSYRCSTPIDEWGVRACQCEYCVPKNARYISDATASLQVTVHDRRVLYAHSFGTRTADFMHCALCNSLVYVVSEIDEHSYALVVADALEQRGALGSATPFDYDDEQLGARLDRRAERWIRRFELVETREVATS